MIENRKNLIARAFQTDGLYSFWKFVLDKGQDLEYGDFRIPACRLVDTKVLENILKEEKKRLLSSFNKRIPAHRVSCSIKTLEAAKRKRPVFIIGF